LARLDPLIERVWRRTGLRNTVQLVTIGRRTGLERRSFLGLLRLRDRRYLGHPDLPCPWTLNLEAAGGAVMRFRDGQAVRFRAVLLEPGPERDAVIRATFRQHGFPGGVIYWIFRRHLFAVGRFYRLEDVAPVGSGAIAGGPPADGRVPSSTRGPGEDLAARGTDT
jgi:hypothetical protein